MYPCLSPRTRFLPWGQKRSCPAMAKRYFRIFPKKLMKALRIAGITLALLLSLAALLLSVLYRRSNLETKNPGETAPQQGPPPDLQRAGRAEGVHAHGMEDRAQALRRTGDQRTLSLAAAASTRARFMVVP